METRGWPGVPAGGGAASDVTRKSQSAAVYVAGPSAVDRPALRCGRRSQLDSQRAGLPWGPGELAGQMPIGGSKGGTGGVSLASYRNRVRYEATSFGPAQSERPPPPHPTRSGSTPTILLLGACPDPQLQHDLPCSPVPASTPISNRSCAAPKLRHRPSVPVPTQFSSVPQFLPGTSPQVETKKCERLAGSAHPEAVKVSRRLGQSSVSRGFILTYTT